MTTLSLAIAGALTFGLATGIGRSLLRARRHRLAYARAKAARTSPPDTVHPRVDRHRCICSGACIQACPERDVLGFVDGRLRVLDSARCVGHGECVRSCPVEALTLVIGSSARGVELPVLASDFSTNVPGIYVAGELGGMGLIHNAISQGVQAMKAISARLARATSSDADVLDVIVVGAGPAGLAAGLEAHKAGLRYAVLEQGEPGGAVRAFPRHKIVMTSPAELPLYGKVKLRRTTKEALLALWEEVLSRTGARIENGVRVTALTRNDARDVIELETSTGRRRARAVVLAIGRRGTPRKLGVPGESQSKVTYALEDAAQYVGTRCLVVGGGDSALEAALSLVDAGADVSLSFRDDAPDRARAENRARVVAAHEAGRLRVLARTAVRRIDARCVELDGVNEPIDNDYVFVCIGGELPTAYLRAAGIEVRTLHGEPLYAGSIASPRPR